MMAEEEETPEALDPAAGVQASVWRSWSEHARPELLEEFNARSLACMKGVRRQYPADCAPKDPAYRDMRREMINALNRLSEAVQGEYDEQHQAIEHSDES